MNQKNANIYYFNELTNLFEIIKLNTEYNGDGYYEFYINHNSKYVITTDKIEDKNLSNVETIEKNNNIDMKSKLLMIIPGAIILILVIVIIMLIIKEKKLKKSLKK